MNEPHKNQEFERRSPSNANNKTRLKWDDAAPRVVVDVASALLAGIAVSPVVTAIDVSVANKAFRPEQAFSRVFSDTLRRLPSLILTRPSRYMLALYAGTYVTANVSDTIESLNTGALAAATTNSLTKFAAVSSINICLSLAKDNEIAKACGGGTCPKRMPLVCYPPLLLRDAISLYATFNLPASLAGSLPASWETLGSRLMIAQIVLPIASQTVATPLHLVGLNLYYANGRESTWQRFKSVREAYLSTTVARMARVVPGLAIGNVVNTSVRTALMNR